MKADTEATIALTLLLSLIVIVLFIIGMGMSQCSEDSSRKIKCEKAGGIYKEFYGSKSICLSPTAILPI